MTYLKPPFFAALLWALSSVGVQAHEFWIEPEAYQIPVGDPLVAHIRVGEDFAGSGFSFNPRRFHRFDLALNGRLHPVPGRAGDRPAVSMAAPEAGLAVLVHVTTDLHLSYNKAGKFEAFLRHKDWLPLLAEHEARGLPEVGFRERYSRYGKSLIAFGAGQGADQPFGLETELVAQANPYTEELSQMPVQLLYQGAPRTHAQVELFDKAPDGTVQVTLHRTDDRGVAHLPVRAGHSYLVDAVVIRPLQPEAERDPVWESLWASLTFSVPGP